MIIVTLITGMATQAQETTPTVNVMGEGKVTVVPDEVTIRVGVETTGKEAAAVKTENDKDVDEVLRFTKKMGIPENHVQTEYVQLNKNYDYQNKTYNFRANQTISIKLEDLDKYEELMSGLVASGINNIAGVNFASSEIEKYKSQARNKALANAKSKATEYATVLGQSIGRAVMISELGTSSPQPQPKYRMMAMADSVEGASQETLAPGEITITERIQVSFILN